jgi:hypothetical protein
VDDFFTSAETVQLRLDDYGFPGQWVEAKERLTYGEEQELANGVFTGMTTGTNSQINLDMGRQAIRRLTVWLTDWSFTQGGKRVKLTTESVGSLNPKVADAINQALDDHIERTEEGKGEGIVEIALVKK